MPQTIPVPVVSSVRSPNPKRAASMAPRSHKAKQPGGSHKAKQPDELTLAQSLSISDTTAAELAAALGTWPERREWDRLRHAQVQKQLHAQAGTSVWRQPVLAAAALLRQSAGTPSARDGQQHAAGAPCPAVPQSVKHAIGLAAELDTAIQMVSVKTLLT